MNNLTRRSLLTGTGLLVAGLVSSCATQSPVTPPAPAPAPTNIITKVEQITQSIINGFTTFIEKFPVTPTNLSVFTTIQTYITNIQTIIYKVKPTFSMTQLKTSVSGIVTIVNDILAIAASLPLPAPLSIILQAVSTVLPLLENLVGLTTTKLSFAVNTMTVSQAFAILNAH
jgi:hypothetical protein